jgi:hypothetical protein
MESAKVRKHADYCKSVGAEPLKPFVVETYGAIGKSADKVLEWIADEYATTHGRGGDQKHHDRTRDAFHKHARATVAFAIARGVAHVYFTGCRTMDSCPAALRNARARSGAPPRRSASLGAVTAIAKVFDNDSDGGDGSDDDDDDDHVSPPAVVRSGRRSSR